jgi:hypothetical protein
VAWEAARARLARRRQPVPGLWIRWQVRLAAKVAMAPLAATGATQLRQRTRRRQEAGRQWPKRPRRAAYGGRDCPPEPPAPRTQHRTPKLQRARWRKRGQAQSTAKTSLAGISVQSAAVAQVGSTATTNAISQGGAGQAFANPGQTAYAFSTALPAKA